jgi:Anthranilate synthase component I, N terminal region.
VGVNSRYDILFAAPQQTIVAHNPAEVKSLLATINQKPGQNISRLPFEYGWLLYLSYEAASCWLGKLEIPPKQHRLAAAIYCTGAIVYDHDTEITYLCGNSQAVIEAIERRLNCVNNKPLKQNHFHFNSCGVQTAFSTRYRDLSKIHSSR